MTLLRTLRAAAATTALVAAAAACGDDASTSAPPQPTVTVTATPSTEATSPSVEATPSLEPLTVVPMTYSEALAVIEGADDVTEQGAAELVEFTTPSGDVYCAVDVDSLPAGCELGKGAVPDPEVCADAPTPTVGRVELRSGRAVPVCNTDTIVRPGAPILRIGEAAYTRDTACTSTQTGVACVSRGGQGGFFLGPGEYELF